MVAAPSLGLWMGFLPDPMAKVDGANMRENSAPFCEP